MGSGQACRVLRTIKKQFDRVTIKSGSETGKSRRSQTPDVHSSQRSKLENRKVNFRGRIQAGPINPDHQRLGYGGLMPIMC